jgi:hypothetical protein
MQNNLFKIPIPFLGFCHKLHKRYRFDERSMMILGDNFQSGQIRVVGSCYFFKNCHFGDGVHGKGLGNMMMSI